MGSKYNDWINIPLIEEDYQIDLGELRIFATLEIDYNGAPFYTVTHYTFRDQKFDYGIYNPTKLDLQIEDAALRYWTDDRIRQIFAAYDAGLDHQLEVAREVRDENRAYQEAVL
jgi:hypothetical protein